MIDVSTCDMSSALPESRPDIEISPQIGEGSRYYHLLKDSLSGEIFEFGEEEVFLYRKFDGQTTLSDIQESFEEQFKVSISLNQIKAFVRQLGDLGLLLSTHGTAIAGQDNGTPLIQRRLCNPNRFLDVLTFFIGWCFSPLLLACFGLVFLSAIGIAIKFASDFILEVELGLKAVFLVPVLGILVVNFVGELAKGIACKHSGSQVNELGVILLYRILPRFYFDIRESLWKVKKIERLQITAAGPIFQLLLWSIAVIGWKVTHPWSNMHDFWILLIVASSIILFLNLNPLAQRDGYLLLSIWHEAPDLRNRALAYFRSWFFRRSLPEPLTAKEMKWFKLYGAAIIIYETIFWTVVLGLIGYLLMQSLKGLGACLFLVFLGLRFENTLKRQFMRILPARLRPGNELGAIPLRWLIRGGLLTVIILILLVPYPFTVGGEIRLLPVHQLGIRVQVPSNIESVLVEEGQWVKKGQPVAVLMGRDQKKRLETVKAALDEARARLRLLREGPKPEEIAKAEQEVKTSAKSLEYSMLQAGRYEEMFRHKAVPEKDYERVLKVRDVDLEQLKLTERNLELVKSGPRDEEIKALEAEVRRLEVELAHAEEDMRLTTLISPADGRIITPYLSQKKEQYLGVGDLFAVVEDARTIIAEIEVPEEDVGEVRIGARVKLKTWVYPGTTFIGHVTAIAPVAYEKSRHRVERALSENEWRIEQKEILREKGKVVRLLSELPNPDGLLKTDMTGYAKIECGWKPLGIAFTRWAVRFFMIEVWSWIP